MTDHARHICACDKGARGAARHGGEHAELYFGGLKAWSIRIPIDDRKKRAGVVKGMGVAAAVIVSARPASPGNVLLRRNLAARCSQKIGPSLVPGSDTSDHGGGAGLAGSISPSSTRFSSARTAAAKASAI